MILVDTCIWSLALRRNRRDLNPRERHVVFALRDLIVAEDACLIRPIRQEILSDLSSPAACTALQKQIEPQIDLPLTTDVWHLAEEFFVSCHSAGIAVDDMTICAAANTHGTPIFSTDPDFARYAKHLPIGLFHP